MTSLLEVQNLSLSYQTSAGEVHAIRNISFSIKPKEIVALVGESGCGKTTAGLALLGLLPPSSKGSVKGNIIFNGQNILSLSKRQLLNLRGKEISMVFQDPMTSLNPTMTVGKQIMEGMLKENLSKEAAKNEALRILKTVGIDDPQRRIDQYPHELSGGMRQRVMIAIAVSLKPKLLIADEPTTALDVTIQAQVLDLLKELYEQQDMAILLITHDLGLVAHIANRVIVMYGGSIVEEGPCHQIFSSSHHPYTQGLLRCLPTLDWAKEKKLESIEGSPPSLLRPPKGCPFYARCPLSMKICPTEFPSFRSPSENHHVACWYYDKPH